MPGLLSIERRGALAVVTLRRPEKRNALSIDLRVELADSFAGLGGDPDIGCIVLTGAGTAFCSGMDITQFGGDAEHKQRLVDSSIRAFAAVGECKRPVVVAVNGPALAGGFALAMLCDLRVADPTAVFGFSELPRGIPPSYGSIRTALGEGLASELALTGRLVEAEEALRLGMVSEVSAPGEVVSRALALAERIASSPGAAIETKRRILLDRAHRLGHLVADEQRALEAALLGDIPDDAA